MTEATNGGAEGASEGGQQEQGKSFSQEDVNRIVSARLKEQAENKFGDYEELRKQANGAKTVEQKLADLEKRYADAEVQALRTSVAAEHGISTKRGPNGEPSDADLFLTGTDADTLAAQAKRLSERASDRKKQGNVAHREGGTTSTGKGDDELREWARGVFSRAD